MISTGKSSLKAVYALRRAQTEVLGMIALFTYGFPTAVENFKEAAVKLYTLSDYSTLIAVAKQKMAIDDTELELLKKWRENPSEWESNA